MQSVNFSPALNLPNSTVICFTIEKRRQPSGCDGVVRVLDKKLWVHIQALAIFKCSFFFPPGIDKLDGRVGNTTNC